MKRVFFKRTFWATLAFIVMTVAFFGAMTIASAEENAFVSRTLYYVDAGNVVDDSGNKTNRGAGGSTSTAVTPAMTERGLAYATQAGDTTKLYNSGTDKLYGADAVSGKSWGFVYYEGHDWWRHALTGSSVDGFDTVRLIEGTDTVTLKYIFEVDDDTTFLKIILGTRMVNGWQPMSFSVKVNDKDVGLANGGETEQTFNYYTTGKLDADSGKYFVTIEMGNGNAQTVYCKTLEVATANPDTEGLDKTPYNFVKKGETPRLYKWDGSYVSTTLSAEDQAKIDSADYFGSVTVNCTYGEQTFSDVVVTVLPATLEYFLDVGGAGDGKMMLSDRIYTESEGKTCGVADDKKGNDGWQAFGYDQSCRYDVNWNPMQFVFDVDAGAYGVIVGTYHFDNSVTERTSYMQLNSDEYVEVNATYGTASHTSAYTIMENDGQLQANFTANWQYTTADKQNYPLVTYIAVYRVAMVTFNTDGADEIDAQVFEYGQKATKPADPVLEGYTFGGWYSDETLETVFDFDAAVSQDITLYAKLTKNVYTVKFEGTDIADQTVEYGAKVTKPADPTKEGYTFGGWYTNEELTTAYDFATVVNQGVTLYAKWTKNVYTVKFEGADIADQNVEYGAKVTKPADPTKEGYTFDGWFVGDKQYDFDTAVTANITLTAKFTENEVGCFGVVGAGAAAVAAVVGICLVVFAKKKQD